MIALSLQSFEKRMDFSSFREQTWGYAPERPEEKERSSAGASGKSPLWGQKQQAGPGYLHIHGWCGFSSFLSFGLWAGQDSVLAGLRYRGWTIQPGRVVGEQGVSSLPTANNAPASVSWWLYPVCPELLHHKLAEVVPKCEEGIFNAAKIGIIVTLIYC